MGLPIISSGFETAAGVRGLTGCHSSIRYSGAAPINQAVSDHKGDLEFDPSPDWKPVELVADGD